MTDKEQQDRIHSELLKEFDRVGWRGPCERCGYEPGSQMSVSQWLLHIAIDRIAGI